MTIHEPLSLFLARIIACIAGVFILLLAAESRVAAAQSLALPTIEPSQDAAMFVRDVLLTELEAQLHEQVLWTYRLRKTEDGQEKLFAVCQTKDGEIDRLLTVNGQPLSWEAAQAEDRRIQKLIAHPSQLYQRQKKQRDDAEQARNLLKAFLEAFRFQYDGMRENRVALTFTPNPKFHPSGRVQQVFRHMEGTLLLDSEHKRLTGIDAKLTSEVKFDGGLLGHLDKGGTFSVRLQEVSAGYWEITSMRIQMIGKALFFKTLNVQQDETYSDFRLLPANTSLQRATELLNDSVKLLASWK